MKIIYLELVGFKRFSLNGIKRFTIRPEEAIQLILGTNGSGKSSLISELTPLPAEASNYLKEGSKTIELIANNKRYVLKSTFNSGQRHSFEENNEELNPGGTITVQRELVKQYFGITQDIQDLIAGVELFTGMSPGKRREWFTRLSDVSYDYALGVYGRLKDRLRDTSGALKHAKKRLVAEKSKIISSIEIDRIKKEVNQGLGELDILFQNRNALSRSVVSVLNDVEANKINLTNLLKQFEKIKLTQPNEKSLCLDGVFYRNEWSEYIPRFFASIDDIDFAISEFKSVIGVKEVLIKQKFEEHGEVSKKIAILKKTGSEGIKSLISKVHLIQEARNSALEKRILKLEGLDVYQAKNALEAVLEPLMAILAEIPENRDKWFSSAQQNQFQEQLLTLKKEHYKEKTDFDRLVSQRTHMEVHKASNTVECPSCKYSWHLGYSEKAYEKILFLIEEKNDSLVKKEKEIETCQANIEKIKDYSVLYRSYVQYSRTVTALTPLWNYYAENDLIFNAPRKALSDLEFFKQDLIYEEEVFLKEKQIAELKELIIAAEKVGDESLNSLTNTLSHVDGQVSVLTNELASVRYNLNQCLQYRKNIVDATVLREKIEEHLKKEELLKDEQIDAIRAECISQCIRELQLTLASRQDILANVAIQIGLIQDLEAQIENLTIEEEACKVLVAELSPTEGLIAEGLLGFIRYFVNKMNKLIRKIWSYPLEIQTCEVDKEGSAELDYRFPVLVKSKSNSIPDVKLGSTGMKEIFDLAFKVTAMQSLGLVNIPLVLDEFGKTMDKTHKSAATDFVRNLLVQHSFSQLFMVSHDYIQYGSISNVDVCVLCSSNIVVPEKYNKHVVIEM